MICGFDFAGEVVEIGPNINPKVSHKIGERVVGIVRGGDYSSESFVTATSSNATTPRC